MVKIVLISEFTSIPILCPWCTDETIIEFVEKVDRNHVKRFSLRKRMFVSSMWRYQNSHTGTNHLRWIELRKHFEYLWAKVVLIQVSMSPDGDIWDRYYKLG